ncbi:MULTISPECIES: SPFH domain-containing protein [Bacillus]|uniref:SPFH domain-containing protein n=1 Tax=Bacillus paramycoides TaxID=2026194 RepID=A0A1J9UQT7_9BACI|nr:MULTISPECIES: SPFH domain-containing protein [Bacillus]KMN42676.1 membrane protein [Bacillus sp. LK2]MED0958499.1 SPFH domain-containing protein [Bacillus paramycoides]MED0972337.1 SPFH domain-containing protein [Bacillus paramycoides]MED0981925.1 SPFH domain-containing protein [Bacillus paramycoides]MED0984301.1 SPFH domain-containing protein [Bacillus paramycoides]
MKEKQVFYVNGFLGIIGILILAAIGVFCLVQEIFIVAALTIILAAVLATGIGIVQPNQAKVITFFGNYLGTIRQNGLFLTIPFAFRQTVSLRVENFNSKKLKVNDVEGNPIEIAAVIVYKVVDSAKAIFGVEHYDRFVEIQSETAIRHVATKYPYDNFQDETCITLRGNTVEISEELKRELEARLEIAGVEVLETRLTHLAYATEIAHAMLQRQQAKAVLAARKEIVEGAVKMAKDSILMLDEEGVLDLDDERKANMVNNLLVAIVSDKGAQPVINTGSLY